MMLKSLALAFVIAWFVLGGIGHFVLTDAFVSVVPAYVPYPRWVVLATGVIEIAAALALCAPRLRRPVGWALMAFTVFVTPVHVDMLVHAERHEIGALALWLRLAFQPVFVWIIWYGTRRTREAPVSTGAADSP